MLSIEIDGKPERAIDARLIRWRGGNDQAAGPNRLVDDVTVLGQRDDHGKRALHRDGDANHQHQQLVNSGSTSSIVHRSEHRFRGDVANPFDRMHSSEVFDFGMTGCVDHHGGQLGSVIVDGRAAVDHGEH